LIIFASGLWAQDTGFAIETGDRSAPVIHSISFPAREAQYVRVLSKFQVSGTATEFIMPNWTPGSYEIRDYAANVENFLASGPSGETLPVEKTSKNRWRVEHGSLSEVSIGYDSWAGEFSVSSSWAEAEFALLNPVSLFFYSNHSRSSTQVVDVTLPEDWRNVFSSMTSNGSPMSFRASDFDELADSPMLLGNPTHHRFTVKDSAFHLVNLGETAVWDSAQSVRDLSAVVEAHLDFWTVNPFDRDYYFLNLMLGKNHGLEHDYSAVTTTNPWQMRKREDYVKWLALMSHEFFHAWNVRRMRPEALTEYDYEREVYTRELWLAEGLSSYYDNLLLFRSGVISVNEYFDLLALEIQRYEVAPGRKVRSAELASFDSWIKHYQPNPNNVNSTTSYYNKGSLIGFVVDAEIRRETRGKKALDDVMQAMYLRYGPGPAQTGYPSGAFERLVEETSGPKASAMARQLISTTSDPDVDRALEWYGLQLFRTPDVAPGKEDDSESTPGFGVTWQTETGQLLIKEVIHGGSGARSGLLPGDELIAINETRVNSGNIQDLISRLKVGEQITLIIARRGVISTVPMEVGPSIVAEYLISPTKDIFGKQQGRLERWLQRKLYISR
jgi:predicted metalloprotease with PDZ domain